MSISKDFILILLIITLVLFAAFVWWIFQRQELHARNQITGKKVLQKINSFSGPFKEQKIITYLRKINPFVFEELLLHSFKKKGFQVILNKKYTGDGGIDGKLIDQNGRVILVQAKRYSKHINLQHIKEFALLLEVQGASEGYFIHTGRTGKAVYEHIPGRNIKIISGSKLVDLVLF